MSMAFRGQPQYAQSPMGGYNMSGYGGDVMQPTMGGYGDFGGYGGYGSMSSPASMGGSYSMFGSYNPMPYQQQSYTGGYVPGYGSQFGGGYGNMYGAAPGGGFGSGFGNIGMPQMQQPNVNDLFGQYMFGQYYGAPAFNPFQATSMFGGQRGRGGFGGGRRGGRERFPQPPQMSNPGRFGPVQQPLMRTLPLETAEPAPIIYDTMPLNPRQFPIDTPTQSEQYEQAMPYSFGPINMGSLPMFVDSYAGLYNNPFSFR